MPQTATNKTSTTRPVLVWHPDNDESQVLPTLQQAADLLKVPPAQVLAAIASGDLLNGRFVDWQA